MQDDLHKKDALSWGAISDATNVSNFDLHLGLIGSLRNLTNELTELVITDLLLLRLWSKILSLRLLQACAWVLARLFVRIRRLRWLIVNVDASGPATPACRLFTVTRLRWLNLFLVVYTMRISFRAPAMVLLLLSTHICILLVRQLLLRAMQTTTGCTSSVLLLLSELLRGLFEIIWILL